MPMSEKEFRAEMDARTLAEAQVITQDRGRLKAAQKKAKQMADEQAKEAAAIRSVAGGEKPKPNKKKPRKRQPAKQTPTYNVFQRLNR